MNVVINNEFEIILGRWVEIYEFKKSKIVDEKNKLLVSLRHDIIQIFGSKKIFEQNENDVRDIMKKYLPREYSNVNDKTNTMFKKLCLFCFGEVSTKL